MAQAVLIEHSTAGRLVYDDFETVNPGDFPDTSIWTTNEGTGDSIRVTDSAPPVGAAEGDQCLKILIQSAYDGKALATYATQTTGVLHYEWMIYPATGSSPAYYTEDIFMRPGLASRDDLLISDHGAGNGYYEPGITVAKDQWHKMEINYDFDNHRFEVVVDDIFSTGWLQKFADPTYGDVVGSQLKATDVGQTAGSTHYIDAVVPEPSTLVLLGCGLIGLLAYAWRKRK